MKKLAFFVSTLIAGAAAASSVSSETTFGVLKVTSTNEETVISIPWVAAGTGEAVKVKDFVKTTDMIEGDELYLYETNSNQFVAWQYNGYSWVAMPSVTEDSEFGGVTIVTNEVATVDQGSALVIKRKARTLPTTMPENIYLYGQYAASTSTSVGYSPSVKFTTLFAPVNLEGVDVNLNDLGSGKYLHWTNAIAGDKIRLQDANGYVVTYTYRYTTTGNKWSYMNNSDAKGLVGVLRAGQGAWYVAKAGARDGAPTCEIRATGD